MYHSNEGYWNGVGCARMGVKGKWKFLYPCSILLGTMKLGLLKNWIYKTSQRKQFKKNNLMPLKLKNLKTIAGSK